MDGRPVQGVSPSEPGIGSGSNSQQNHLLLHEKEIQLTGKMTSHTPFGMTYGGDPEKETTTNSPLGNIESSDGLSICG